jgi:Ankyrin repeats (many copies)
MVDCLLDNIKSGYDPRLSPKSLDFGRIDARIRDILASIDHYVVGEGLRRDVENNVVRLMWIDPHSEAAVQTMQQVQNMGQASALLQSVLEKVYDDDAEALDALLRQKNSLAEGFKNRLITIAADFGCRKVLRTLILKHGANPNHIDKISRRKLESILDATMRNDYPTMMTLVDCGADLEHFIERGVMDCVIRTGIPVIMQICLDVLQARKVASDNENLFGGSSLCHQFLDGICPAMSLMWQDKVEIPSDVASPPPLIEAVIFNRLDKIQALLAKGADPNVCSQGMNAVHVAVRCLHLTALLLLLAFGADPNSCNSREGYTTPLHTLSEQRLKLPSDSPGYGFKGKDFLLRDYEPLPEEDNELMHR